MGTEESELQNLPAEESHMNHIQEAWKVRLHGYLKLRERERETHLIWWREMNV